MAEANQPLWKDYRLHVLVLLFTVAAELIGSQTVTAGGISVTFAPLIFSMIMMTVFYLLPQNLVNEKTVKVASPMMNVACALLMAKMGVTSGASLDLVAEAGVGVIIQNFGDALTMTFALPVAIFFKMKREAIGMTFGLSREANVALISDKYGADSPEFRGVMTNYIVGTIFGVLAISFYSSLLLNFSFFSPQAIAMAVGVGSASMMSGGLASLIERFPAMEAELTAYASISNLISGAIAIYLAIFVALPLTEKLFALLGRGEAAEPAVAPALAEAALAEALVEVEEGN